MPRTEYNEIDANSQFEDYSVAKKKLKDALELDEYTNGTVTNKAGAEAQSIDYQVRKQLDAKKRN